MRVLKIYPDNPPLLREIDNTLEALQNEVGGYIETVSLPGELVIICNEDGVNLRFPLNRTLVFKTPAGNFYNVPILGCFIICGTDGEEFRGLTDQEIRDMSKLFEKNRVNINED